MGSYFSTSVEDTFKRNQAFIAEMNKIKMDRVIQMQNQMRERAMAMEIARQREMFLWFGSFYILAATGLLTGFKRTKKPSMIVPLLPLSFAFAYQADLAFGNKIHRIRAEADHIMQFESDILGLPCGLPTSDDIDTARLTVDQEKRLHPAAPVV